MTLFSQEFKDEVRTKNDIVEVVSAYVKLEQRGNRYVGLCPFHGEKTPSFHVIPHMQIYHCFGCKVSGDVFKFIQEQEHLTFYEAVAQLAQRARIPLPQEERTPAEEQAYQERRSMYDALDLAARFFQNQLYSDPGKPALDYLYRRGLTDESIRQFRLGWAPSSSRLFQSIRSRFRPELLQKAGLIVPRREGSGYVDAFFERVMFPITDLTGRVIGFGGRILDSHGPKYKNTADTALFAKRQVLFGLSHAKEMMRTRNQAILVEGYMDVIVPYQMGFKNVVAPLGTALTDEQSQLIRRQAEQVIVAFDADTAGQIATLRGLEKLYESGCDIRILRLPEGKDPDEYIREHGVEGFQKRIDEATPLVEFKLGLALGSDPHQSAESFQKALDGVARVLLDLKSDLAREEYANQIAQRLAPTATEVPGFKTAIDRQMNRLRRQGFQHNQPNFRNNMRGPGANTPDFSRSNTEKSATGLIAAHTERVTGSDLVFRAERNLLLLLLQAPGLLSRIEAELGQTPFLDPLHTLILDVARASQSGADSGQLAARVLDRLNNPDARALVTEMAVTSRVSAHSEQEATDCIEKIKQHRVSRRIADLNDLIKDREAAGELPDNAVLQELITLQLAQKRASKS